MKKKMFAVSYILERLMSLLADAWLKSANEREVNLSHNSAKLKEYLPLPQKVVIS